MANAAEEDDIDFETLQAKIDMSMALTQNLVSSWMNSSEGKLPAAKSEYEEQRELEEYMRRPPRLGVGAAIPESTSMFGRDAARLKSKLLSNTDKKRSRAKKEDDVALQSDDEDESKTRTIRKKQKIDVFASKKKKGKPKPIIIDDSPVIVREQRDTPDVQGVKHSETSKKVPSEMAGQAQPDLQSIEQGSLLDSTLSITKKNKAPSINRFTVDSTTSTTPSTSNNHSTSHTAPAINNSNCDDTDVLNPSGTKGNDEATQSAPHQSLAGSLPLLNLNGPPETVEESAQISTKKRKRKKKKKKKKMAVVEVATDSDVSDD